ncbi:MAG: MarR family transcriptional regulator [Phycisphaerales bacterium]|nr:MarR family transcriptional regulator [Phycisphaerales bacterium]
MSHADRVMARLRLGTSPMCDDCIAETCGPMKSRQIARRVCMDMEVARLVFRDQRHCGRCRGFKICSSLNSAPPAPIAPRSLAVSQQSNATVSGAPWHWEGHVQLRIQRWLEQTDWIVSQAVDTASKMQGIDLICSQNERTLWVTVKGYPNGTAKTNPSTQARHWYSHALMDVVLYRGKDPNVEIAIGLPDGYTSYLSLAQRTRWLRASCPFRIFWAREDGNVREER